VSWSALGEDPAPGDVGAVDRVASGFAAVSDRAEALLGRLRTIDSGSGPNVWRGPASESFRTRLAEAGPQLTALATSYRSAHDAMTAYGRALDDAQRLARQAETDGERAVADRSLAERHRNQARVEAATQRARRLAAQLAIAEAQGLQLASAALGNPAYAAALRTFEQQQRDVKAHAATREAEADARAGAAEREAQEAITRLDAARARGRQAKDDHERAVTTAVRALEQAGDASGIPLSAWQRAVRNAHGNGSLTFGSGLDGARDFLDDVLQGDKDGFLSLVSGRVDGGTDVYDGSWKYAGKDGSADASFQAFGADGHAEGSIGLFSDGSYGAQVGAGGSAYLLRGDANARWGRGPFSAEANVDGMVGARGNANGDIRFGRDGIKAGINAEAFAGAEVTASGTLGAGPLKQKAGVSAQAGIGGSADLDLGFKDGKFSFGGKLGLAVGVGAKVDLDTEIDVGGITRGISGAGKGAGKTFASAEKKFSSIKSLF
jgi:hypothetical protein